MSADQRRDLKVTSITTGKATNVAVTPADLDRITALIRAEMEARNASHILPEGSPEGAVVGVTLTSYNEGNAFARAMLAGLGQIHIDGDVVVTDRKSGAVMASYKVSKHFAFGGIVGAVTSIQDVEKGFARSVAEAVLPSK